MLKFAGTQCAVTCALGHVGMCRCKTGVEDAGQLHLQLKDVRIFVCIAWLSSGPQVELIFRKMLDISWNECIGICLYSIVLWLCLGAFPRCEHTLIVCKSSVGNSKSIYIKRLEASLWQGVLTAHKYVYTHCELTAHKNVHTQWASIFTRQAIYSQFRTTTDISGKNLTKRGTNSQTTVNHMHVHLHGYFKKFRL